MQLALIAGARPNFVKLAPLCRALTNANAAVRLVHTGQHYDPALSGALFADLNLPAPEVNLEVGSGPPVWQSAEIMRRLEPVLAADRPDAVVVVGDVNSTLAAALTAARLDLPVAHVEAGLRSFDRSMPEETNRILIDAVARWLFTTEPSANANLAREGVAADRIHYVGNVMIDALLEHLPAARGLAYWKEPGLEPGHYAVLTLHRPGNVDEPQRLVSILAAVAAIHSRLPIVFPVHPRTRRQMEAIGISPPGIVIEPLGYLAMLSLLAEARLVLTDSGGIQEETTALGCPCLTLRENTERPITIELGSNRLVGWRTERIIAAVHEVLAGPSRIGTIPQLWDGRAAERIAGVLMRERRRPERMGSK